MKNPAESNESSNQLALMIACAFYSVIVMFRELHQQSSDSNTPRIVPFLLSVARSKSEALSLAASVLVRQPELVEESWMRAQTPRSEVILLATHLKLQKSSMSDQYRFHQVIHGLMAAASDEFGGTFSNDGFNQSEQSLVRRIGQMLWTGELDGDLDKYWDWYLEFSPAAAKFVSKNGM